MIRHNIRHGSTFIKKLINLQNIVDEWKIYDILFYSALKNTQTVVFAQFATGGRLGVKLCQM